MRAWLEYAAAGLVLIGATAGLLTLAVAPSDRGALWFGAAVSYVVQLGAFGALLAFRDNAQMLTLGWVSGIVIRFVTVGIVVVLLTRTGLFPIRTALLSLIGFVFVLTLLEPVFLRRVRATQ